MERVAVRQHLQQDCCTCELTVAVDACTRPAQGQANGHYILDVGGTPEAPPLAEELWHLKTAGVETSPLQEVAPGRLPMI